MTAQEHVVGADPLALEEQVCFALSVAARNVVAVYRPFLEPLGLTHPQYLVMLALWQGAPLSVSEVSRRLQLEPATLSPLLKRLEQAGLVTRRRNPEDDRALLVDLTDAGRELRASALQVPEAVVARLGTDVVELLDLHRRLSHLIEVSRAALDAPARGADGTI